MCLILFAVDVHPEYSLVLAANRDEFYARPSAPAAFWDAASGVLAGRDLSEGGTWLGVNRSGRWCAVTNYRDGRIAAPTGRSRGILVSDFLLHDRPPYAYADDLENAEPMAGYNLVAGDASVVCYTSNRGGSARKLAPEIYGLSNHLLDTPWPKVQRGKAALASIVHGPIHRIRDDLFNLLQDDSMAPDEQLPDTGVDAQFEKCLSPIFIQTPNYGTRCSTVLLISHAGKVVFEERTFGDDWEAMHLRRFEFTTVNPARLEATSLIGA